MPMIEDGSTIPPTEGESTRAGPITKVRPEVAQISDD